MNIEEKKYEVLGILGGMGPEATAHLYELIIKHTPASKDQDHIPTVIYSNTLIPDRTTCILRGEHEKIIEILSKSAQLLENTNVDVIIIPCNTAHYYLEDIRKNIKIPILDMIKITAEYLYDKLTKQENINIKLKIGLLATTGTIRTEIYQKRFEQFKVNIITPNDTQQEEVMSIINEIKKNGPSEMLKSKLNKIISNLREKKEIKWIILGCTELPLLYKNEDDLEQFFLVDPMVILSKYVIRKMKNLQ